MNTNKLFLISKKFGWGEGKLVLPQMYILLNGSSIILSSSREKKE